MSTVLPSPSPLLSIHSRPHSETGVGETEGSGANTGPVDASKSRPRRKSEKDKKLKKEDKQNIIKYFNQTINTMVKKKYGKKGFYVSQYSIEFLPILIVSVPIQIGRNHDHFGSSEESSQERISHD